MIKKLFRTFFKIFSVVNKYHHYEIYFMLFINFILSGILPVLVVYIPKATIKLITSEYSFEYIAKYLGIYFLILLSISIIVEILKHVYICISFYLRVELSKEFIAKYQKIDYCYLEDNKFRDRVETGSAAVFNSYNSFEGCYNLLFSLLPYILSIIFYVTILFVFNIYVVISCIIASCIFIFTGYKTLKYRDSRKNDLSKARRQMNYYRDISYDFKYGKDIRLFDLNERISTEYLKKSNNLISILKDISLNKFFYGFVDVAMFIIKDIVAYGIIIYAFYHQLITIEDVTLYVGTILSFSSTLIIFASTFSSFLSTLKSCDNYFDLVESSEFVENKRGIKKAFDRKELVDIEFKNVSFKYANTDRYILKNFNFKINAGEKLAVVGLNGAGKTTLIKLICGFFPVEDGEILINGVNINEFSKDEYTKMLSVVFQDYKIYAASIIENVIGNDDSTEARAKGIESLKKLGMSDFIENLPHKYDTSLLKVIDPEGTDLSGGQGQKIAIARALYKDSNLVILDEPTSSLDALAESKIYEAFNKLVENKTSIYISHRLSSTKFCDKIALFTTDGLSEYGTHEELMNLKGEYYNLFMTQGKYYSEAGDENV